VPEADAERNEDIEAEIREELEGKIPWCERIEKISILRG